MLVRHPFVLLFAGLVAAHFGCRERDQTLADAAARDPAGTAGTAGAPDAGGSGGASGSSGELDDPFGIGPRYCDLNAGVGGDACSNFGQVSGFHTEPEHLQTDVSAEATLRVWVATEFTPTTLLKQALEQGLQLHPFGSDSALSFSASWVTEGLDTSDIVRGAYVAAAYDVVPAQALSEGWYSLTIPRTARAALGASYTRFQQPLLLQGGPFAELESGDLRADFHVGSLPFLARVNLIGASARLTFSEQVEAAVPPVTLSVATGSTSCAPEGWAGAGKTLTLTCSRALSEYGQPIRISFGEGLKTSTGALLRGPDGATSFEVELSEDALQFEMPAPFADAGAP